MKVLIIAEHDNQQLKSSNYALLTAARELGDIIDIALIGFECESVQKSALKLPFINQVRVANAKEYTYQLAENTAELIAEIGKDYQYIIMAANTFGKNILPR